MEFYKFNFIPVVQIIYITMLDSSGVASTGPLYQKKKKKKKEK